MERGSRSVPGSVRHHQLHGGAPPDPGRVQRRKQNVVFSALRHWDHDNFTAALQYGGVELVLAVLRWDRCPSDRCDVAVHAAGPPAAGQSTGGLIPGTRR